MNSDFRRFDDDPAASYDGADPARRLLRELPILRLPDDALESVWDATIRVRTVAAKRRRFTFAMGAGAAAAAAVLIVLAVSMTAHDRKAPETPTPAEAESISRAAMGVRLAFGVTERALERFPVLNLLKTTFSSSERKR